MAEESWHCLRSDRLLYFDAFPTDNYIFPGKQRRRGRRAPCPTKKSNLQRVSLQTSGRSNGDTSCSIMFQGFTMREKNIHVVSEHSTTRNERGKCGTAPCVLWIPTVLVSPPWPSVPAPMHDLSVAAMENEESSVNLFVLNPLALSRFRSSLIIQNGRLGGADRQLQACT